MAPNVKLTYFNVRAKAELTRMILTCGKVDFEDCRIPVGGDQWKKDLKPKMPFGQMPLLAWDGEELAQSMSIARFVAKKTGLAGNTDIEQARADMIADHANDFLTKIIPIRWASSQQDREEKVKGFMENFVPPFFESAESLLKKRGGKWFTGSEMSYGDLAMYVMMEFIQDPKERAFKDMTENYGRFQILDKYPLMKDLFKRIQEIPEMKEYLAKRPPTDPPGL